VKTVLAKHILAKPVLAKPVLAKPVLAKPVLAKPVLAKPVLDGAYERLCLSDGMGLIAGVDEVGRGPLAGPVMAAAVILDLADIPLGLADSKTIPAARREALSFEVLTCALAVSIATASPAEIDALNIRQATLLAMRRAVAGLSLRPVLVLVDGRDVPDFGIPAHAIIGGDAKIASISAAAIVAKVARDAMMARLGLTYPAYGFDRNAGYGTAEHRSALRIEGPCPAHRMSFAPLKGT
jgi:ribonuclease HII